MMQVFEIRPAVTHVDGSGRLQTVYRHTNPGYYRLIECFRDLTGVPMVLNTSFNENEPVVCWPEEALDCFLRSKRGPKKAICAVAASMLTPIYHMLN